jgi:putative salt-induced outer membrane protein
MLFRSALTSALVLSACVAHSAVAQTPDAVARLIDAALQSGDAAGLDVVVRYAKQAYPQSAESIDAQIAAFRAVNSAAAPAPEATPVVTAAQQAKTEQAKFEHQIFGRRRTGRIHHHRQCAGDRARRRTETDRRG